MRGMWGAEGGMPNYILMKVTNEHVYWCRQCYGNMCTDYPNDKRAWRKRGDEKMGK